MDLSEGNLASDSGIEVKHLPHHHKVKGLSLVAAAGTGRERENGKKVKGRYLGV